QRDDIEHPDSTADCRFAVLERIPRKADAGSKVLEGRILVVRVAGSDGLVGDVAKVGKLSVDFCDDGGHFIAHSEIQGEVGKYPEIVLNVPGHDGVALAADAIRAGQVGAELIGDYLQHVLDGTKAPESVGAIEFGQVVIDALKRKPSADAMASFG